MAASNVVIKVKYGETLRRFNACVVDGGLDFNMDGLREKVVSLFSFSPDSELNLSYVDEDGDMVALVDDADLHDVVKQSLNPVRIHVKLDSGVNSRPFSRSSESSTPLRSPRVQQPSQNLNSDLLRTVKALHDQFAPSNDEQQPLHNLNLSQILQTVKEPLQEALVKLSTDLAAKASTSAPGVAGLADIVSKLVLSTQDQLSKSQSKVQPSTQSNVPESSTAAKGTADPVKSTVDSSTFKVPTDGKSDEQLLKSGETVSIPQPDVTMEMNERTAKLKKAAGSKHFEITGSSIAAAGCKKEKAKKERIKKLLSDYANEKSRVKSSHKPPVAANGLFVGKFNEFRNSLDLPSATNNVSGGQESLSGPKKIEASNWGGKASEGSSWGKAAWGEASDGGWGKASDGGWGKASEGSGWGKASEGSGWGNASEGSGWGKASEGSGWAKASEGSWGKAWGIPHPDGLFYSPLTGSINDCPFSGTTVGNIPAAPYTVPHPFSSRNGTVHNDGNGIVFHRGVRCDGCGVHPITGPRFKSKVKTDYDLCSICFSRMGNQYDYMRMDRPALYRPPMPFKGLYGSIAGPSMPPQVCKGVKVKLGASKFDSRFIQDINILDGTVLAPSTPFTKIWRMRNNGTAVWPQKTQLLWIGGDKLSNLTSVEVEIPEVGLPVEAELDVAVDFVAPELPGRYISYWRMAAPSGQKFGQRVWVLIQVDSSIQNTSSSESDRGFNLNLPPLAPAAPEIINLDVEPMVEDNHTLPDSSKKTTESVEPVVNAEQQPLQPNLEHELKFPINDSLLIGSGAMNNVSPASSSVSYPIIDQTPVAAPDLPSAADLTQASGVSSVADPGTLNTEEALLWELKEMGFAQAELNREVLRKNGYNLEQTVDALCGVADWDPILEELQEMGFNDTEVNKKLLEKNNGSIKRVVMDLIAGETNM